MYVCSCNVFTDTEVRAVAAEAGSVAQVYRCLGCKPQCGGCARTIRRLLDEVRADVGCGCPQVCPPESHDCPVIERTIEIVRRLDLSALEAETGAAGAHASPAPVAAG
jgi:bacterioferritin-associated ferredoxin